MKVLEHNDELLKRFDSYKSTQAENTPSATLNSTTVEDSEPRIFDEKVIPLEPIKLSFDSKEES